MEDLNARVLPHDLTAEQSVLGSMLIDSRCVPDVVGVLKAGDFYLKQNQEIFETIYVMFSFSEPIDPVMVLNKMKQQGTADERTSDYLMQLMEVTPTAAHAKRYAEIVREMSIRRSLVEASDNIKDAVFEGTGTTEEVLDFSEKEIIKIRSSNSSDQLHKIGTVMVDVYSGLAERAASGQAFPGLSTGLRDLDKKINGLGKSDLIIVAARPGMGKTSFALNIALNVAKKTDKTIAIFNLEMSREQLALRLLSNESFVDNQKLVTGQLSEDDWVKVGMASSALAATDIRINDNPSITVAAMNALCRRLDNLGLVIIDYLQLMTKSGYSENKGDSRVNIVSDISRSLKIMAKELNVPVICLSQLSRASEKREKKDKRPVLSDLRESGSIEQDADSVIMLFREDYYDKDNPEIQNVAECIVAKNRHGETGTVYLQWLPQFTTFSDREWKHEE